MDNDIKETLNYSQTKDKLLLFLSAKENSVMVLATSSHDDVMARSVLVFNDGLDIYFFTWRYSRKYFQIERNNRVSLCKDKIEIEGTAEVLGLMNDEKNKKILEFLRKKQPGAIERWENKSNMVIMRIVPLFACVDGYYINDDAYIEYIDFTRQYAYKTKWGYY
jgi:uncharacterized pyridoxamine 5'-phosphate oxidase family protein